MIHGKKVLITTVYNSENCGSFLQAWSLYYVLKEKGYEVAFLKRNLKHTSHSFSLHLINAAKDIIKCRYSHAYYVIKKWFVFNKLQKQFRIETPNSPFFKEASLQVIGSDTLWNFDTDYFRMMVSTYWGQDFSPKPSITYAVSAANTSLELFTEATMGYKDKKCIVKYLVRDAHTADLVWKTIKEESQIVCDPTMLLPHSYFKRIEKGKPTISDYLLIYCFGNMASMKDAIISYAMSKGLKIVSLLTKRDWCDYSIEADPQLMVTYYRHATCVVSNTFHGTAFSMIYEKPFAVFDEGKNKVKELVQLYGQEERYIKTPESLANCLDAVITDLNRKQYEKVKSHSMSLLIKTINDAII